MILVTYGTRPEYIKIKPLVDKMSRVGIKYHTLFTGQHTTLIGEHEPDLSFEMASLNNNRLNSIVANCLRMPDVLFKDITHILVQGDTSSVMGLALNALHRNIKVIHLEAGLRTNDYENPYPEENNRRIVSTIASIHLCPTEHNKENLIKENILGDIHVVGNTVLDTIVDYQKNISYSNKVLVTLHRRENHENMKLWFKKINKLANDFPSIEFVLPIHPNPNVKKYKHLLNKVKVLEPMDRNELIKFISEAKMVITDSGGIQEESSFLRTKCLVCRTITERPESLGISSFIIKDPNYLRPEFEYHLGRYNLTHSFKCPYGDGYASKKICEILKNKYNL